MKKIFLITTLFTLSLTSLVGASTITPKETHEHIESSNEITPYALICDCGGTFSRQTTDTSNWYVSKYIQCSYNTSKTDKQEYRKVTTYYSCNKCSLTYDTNKTEYRTVCGHK